MKWEKLETLVNWRVRLRPVPKRFEGARELQPEDDVWIVQKVETKVAVELSNTRTGHIARLGNDHIHHFLTDPPSEVDDLKHGILDLDVQICLRGPNLEIEPIRRAPPPRPIESWVDINYAKDSGIQGRLEGQGFDIRWCSEKLLARRIGFEGWQLVIEPNWEGAPSSYKVKDSVSNLVLIKKPRGEQNR